MKKKVLIITYYWPPSGGAGVQRWVKFAKYLPEFDIEPIILTTSNPTYASIDYSLEKDIPETTEVYKSKSIEPFGIYSVLSGKSKSEIAKPSTQIELSTSFGARTASWIRANFFVPDARIGWLFFARKKALQLVEKYSIQTVITTGPPHSTHLIGKYLKKRTSVKWLADFRDPWTNVFYNQLLPKAKLVRNYDLALEKSVLRLADEVIVVSSSMEDLQKKMTDRTYHVIPNGFDHEDFGGLTEPEKKNDVFTIRHIGTLSESAIPEVLFKALEQLPAGLNFRLEFIGNVHERIRELVQKSQISEYVAFIDYIPHTQAVKAMAESDLLLLVIPDVKHNKLIVTGKIFEYIASGKPVLMIGPGNGDAADIINKLQRGAIFNYSDISKLQDFLKNILKDNLNDLQFFGDEEPGYEHPYSRFTLTKQLSELIMNQ